MSRVPTAMSGSSKAFCALLAASLLVPAEAQQPPATSFPTVVLPPGFRIEKIVDGLTYPTAIAWDEQNRLYVAEAGGQFLEEPPPPRILRVENGRATEVVNLEGRGIADSIGGMAYFRGGFYITHRDPADRTGAVSRVTADGIVTRLLSGFVDSQSEHQLNDIRVGPDGRLYVTNGPAGNSGVIGIDVAPFVTRSPTLRPTPCVEYVLTGQNFVTPDFRTTDAGDLATTGAFVPFGTPTTPGQRIAANPKCGGAIFSFDANFAEATLRTVAHGMRNVIGVAWNNRDELYAAVNGYDVRGSRPVNDQYDATYRIREGTWYGFPDFSAALEPVTDPKFDSPDSLQAPVVVAGQMQGKPLRFVIDHAASGLAVPDRALVAGLHEVNSSPSQLDTAPASWGALAGQLFVAEWGDLAPVTTPLRDGNAGFQIVRIDATTGRAVPFIRNQMRGPASAQSAAGQGLERPYSVRFGPDGAMYIVDYGVARVNPARAAQGQVPYEFPPRTGAIWRVTGTATSTAVAVGTVASGIGGAAANTNIAPGGLITITGTNLANATVDLRTSTEPMLPTSLGGAQVSIGGRLAPLLMVSPTMIVAQVPFETAPGQQTVVITSETTTSSAFVVTVAPYAPALLSDAQGGVVLRASDSSRITATNPARAGDVLTIQATGLGQTTPPQVTGMLTPSGTTAATAAVTVTVGGQAAEVVSSVAQPGFPGRALITFRVPAGVSGAALPIVLTAGGVAATPATLVVTASTNPVTGAGRAEQLDPQVQAVFAQYQALGPRPIETLTTEEARRQPSAADAVRALLQRQGRSTAPEPVGSVFDRTIPGAAGDLPVRVYTPQGSGPFPVIVYFHGGGWVIATIDTYDASARALTNAANAIVVSVEYRKAPENRFPAAAEDAYAVTQWVLTNAAVLNGRPDRVAVAGESAGGNLATVASLLARDRRTRLPVHQVLIYPVTDTDATAETPSLVENANAPFLTRAAIGWFVERYLRTPADAASPYASPLRADVSGLPPATVITAGFDPLRDQGAAYAERLRQAGVAVDYANYPDMAHEFFGMGAVVDDARAAVQQVGRNLRAVFGQ